MVWYFLSPCCLLECCEKWTSGELGNPEDLKFEKKGRLSKPAPRNEDWAKVFWSQKSKMSQLLAGIFKANSYQTFGTVFDCLVLDNLTSNWRRRLHSLYSQSLSRPWDVTFDLVGRAWMISQLSLRSNVSFQKNDKQSLYSLFVQHENTFALNFVVCSRDIFKNIYSVVLLKEYMGNSLWKKT